jgi:hypothetical protein
MSNKITKVKEKKAELTDVMDKDAANLETMRQHIAAIRHAIEGEDIASGPVILLLCDKLLEGLIEAKRASRKKDSGITTAFVMTAEAWAAHNDLLNALATLDTSVPVVNATVNAVLEIMSQAKAS